MVAQIYPRSISNCYSKNKFLIVVNACMTYNFRKMDSAITMVFQYFKTESTIGIS